MSELVVVSGNPRAGSRTSVLATAAGTALGGASAVVETALAQKYAAAHGG